MSWSYRRGALTKRHKLNDLVPTRLSCHACRRVVNSESFTEGELFKSRRQCTLCMTVSMLMKNQFKANGPQEKMPTYQAPGTIPPWEKPNNYVKSPELNLKAIPSIDTLVNKSFQLIFVYTYGPEVFLGRKTKGELKISCHRDGRMTGVLSFSPSVKNELELIHPTKIKFQRYANQDPSGQFYVSNFRDFGLFLGRYHFGEMKIIAKRHAIRYMPEKYSCYEDHERQYAQSIDFQNLEEAQTLLDRYHMQPELSDLPLLWITNHLKLPNEVSSLIRGFATNKPEPVLFFEEGDIWLKVNWDSSHHGFTSIFVARLQT